MCILLRMFLMVVVLLLLLLLWSPLCTKIVCVYMLCLCIRKQITNAVLSISIELPADFRWVSPTLCVCGFSFFSAQITNMPILCCCCCCFFSFSHFIGEGASRYIPIQRYHSSKNIETNLEPLHPFSWNVDYRDLANDTNSNERYRIADESSEHTYLRNETREKGEKLLIGIIHTNWNQKQSVKKNRKSRQRMIGANVLLCPYMITK